MRRYGLDNTWFRKTANKCTLLLCVALTSVLLIKVIVPLGEGKDKLGEIFLAQPAFAQQGTAFPSDEAGISAYINVGQTIDLAKVKNAMRGIQAEGSNYVIGTMELPGNPEDEFPHVYVSSDGWILAYYSKFAPAARIFQWNDYGGGTISTTTLQDAIERICRVIGVNVSQIRGDMAYYHFKYPEATKIVIAVDTSFATDDMEWDYFNFSVPYDITLYEASWSYKVTGSKFGDAYVMLDGELATRTKQSTKLWVFFDLAADFLAPGENHSIGMFLDPCYWRTTSNYLSNQCEYVWSGIAVIFIYS